MKTLFKLVFLLAVLTGAYFYFVPGASFSDLTSLIPKPQRVDPVTGKPLIPCPSCQATGQVKCSARGCVDGKVECNGPCLRLTKGTWIKDAKLGHGPDELWMPFREKGGMQYYSKAHVGEVVEMRDGQAVLVGPCKVCAGTTRMPCKNCQGTALVTCRVCNGGKEIPDLKVVSNKPADPAQDIPAPAPPPAATPPSPGQELIRLKDGSAITGRIVIKDPDFLMIRTPDGKTTQIAVKDLAEP